MKIDIVDYSSREVDSDLSIQGQRQMHISEKYSRQRGRTYTCSGGDQQMAPNGP